MHRGMFLAVFAIVFALCGCGDDRVLPVSDEPFDALEHGLPAQGKGQIVFISKSEAGDSYGIYIMKPNGSGRMLVVLLTVPFEDPAISPDGEYIAYTAGDDGMDLYIRHIISGREFKLIEGDCIFPSWSPDGRQIAFASNRNDRLGIYLVDTQTLVEKKLVSSQGNYYRFPSWSLDGSRLVFAEVGKGEIYIINADGTGMTNITNSPEYETSPDW